MTATPLTVHATAISTPAAQAVEFGHVVLQMLSDRKLTQRKFATLVYGIDARTSIPHNIGKTSREMNGCRLPIDKTLIMWSPVLDVEVEALRVLRGPRPPRAGARPVPKSVIGVSCHLSGGGLASLDDQPLARALRTLAALGVAD